MKTKAYSTVGLISHSKLDPKEQQRLDLVQWLQGKVEDLQQQVETSEAELETLQAGAKKKGKAAETGQARQGLLENLNERRNWHISQLEIILRLVENSSLKYEDVEGVKEDVDFFVNENAVRWHLRSPGCPTDEPPVIRMRTLNTMMVFTRSSTLRTTSRQSWTTKARSLRTMKQTVRYSLFFTHQLTVESRTATTTTIFRPQITEARGR